MLATLSSRPFRLPFLLLLLASCCLLQPKAPRLVAALPHQGPLQAVSFGPHLVTTDGARAVAFDPATGQKVAELVTGERLLGVCHSVKGQAAASGADGVTIFDSKLQRVARVAGAAREAAFSADGRTLAVGFESGAGLFDAGTGQLKAQLSGDEACTRVQFRRDGQRVMVQTPDHASVYDGTGKFVRAWYASHFLWSPDGKRFAMLRGKKVEVGTGDEAIAWSVALDSAGYELQFSSDSKLLLVRKDRVAFVVDAAKGKLVARLDYPARVTAVAFHPKKGWLVAGLANGEVAARDARTGKPVCEGLKAGSAVTCLAFDGTGRRLAVGEEAAVCSLWELP